VTVVLEEVSQKIGTDLVPESTVLYFSTYEEKSPKSISSNAVQFLKKETTATFQVLSNSSQYVGYSTLSNVKLLEKPDY
jgi:hypothetical protein